MHRLIGVSQDEVNVVLPIVELFSIQLLKAFVCQIFFAKALLCQVILLTQKKNDIF